MANVVSHEIFIFKFLQLSDMELATCTYLSGIISSKFLHIELVLRQRWKVKHVMAHYVKFNHRQKFLHVETELINDQCMYANNITTDTAVEGVGRMNKPIAIQAPSR